MTKISFDVDFSKDSETLLKEIQDRARTEVEKREIKERAKAFLSNLHEMVNEKIGTSYGNISELIRALAEHASPVMRERISGSSPTGRRKTVSMSKDIFAKIKEGLAQPSPNKAAIARETGVSVVQVRKVAAGGFAEKFGDDSDTITSPAPIIFEPGGMTDEPEEGFPATEPELFDEAPSPPESLLGPESTSEELPLPEPLGVSETPDELEIPESTDEPSDLPPPPDFRDLEEEGSEALEDGPQMPPPPTPEPSDESTGDSPPPPLPEPVLDGEELPTISEEPPTADFVSLGQTESTDETNSPPIPDPEPLEIPFPPEPPSAESPMPPPPPPEAEDAPEPSSSADSSKPFLKLGGSKKKPSLKLGGKSGSSSGLLKGKFSSKITRPPLPPGTAPKDS